jgi:putative flippase GtrA
MNLKKNKFNLNDNFFKFLFGGIYNTILSIALLNLLILEFDANIAFSITWIVGLIFSFYYNKKIVFQKNSSSFYIVFYLIIYLFLYILSLNLFELLILFYNFNKSLSMLIVIFLFIPINYFASKFFFGLQE